MRWALLLLAAGLGAGIALHAADRGLFAHIADSPGHRRAAMALPDGPLQILALGTSLTARGPWPAELEAALQTSRPGSRVEVLARPGANSRWGAAALERRLAEGPAPDAVLIEFATNDASLWHGLSLSDSRASHQRLIAAVRAAGAAPVLIVMAPAHGRERVERPGLPAYQHLYRDAAGAGLIDTIGPWHTLPRAERLRLMPDGLHPQAEAWRRLLLPELIALLDGHAQPAG